jgi:hypothetical protein
VAWGSRLGGAERVERMGVTRMIDGVGKEIEVWMHLLLELKVNFEPLFL